MSKNVKEPAEALLDAIEKLNLFTAPEATSLKVAEDGSLHVLQKSNPIDRMIELAQCYISPLFSDQARQEQEKKLNHIKQEILHARDTLRTHANMIEKLKQGDETEIKLAHSALDVIHRYNAMIAEEDSPLASKYHFHNYERNRLLLDSEIKGQGIELPQNFSVQFDSHSTLPAQKLIKELSAALKGIKKGSTFNSIYKKNDQFMIDTFRMKAIRMLQTHPIQLGSMSEVIGLVKQSTIDIEENQYEVNMRQMLEYCPGFNILVTGTFKRHGQGHKLMNIPILEGLRLSSEMHHAGFPYPAQNTGCAFSEKLVEAHPLRTEQVPLFHFFLQRKNKLSHDFLYDIDTIARSRHQFKMTRQIFNHNHQDFLALHKDLHHSLIQGSDLNQDDADLCLADFFDFVATASSSFDVLAQAHQRINDIFVRDPFVKVEEEWLTTGTILRSGKSQEKLQRTQEVLQEAINEAVKHVSGAHILDRYIRIIGKVLGKASQAIAMQYYSEKIGFAPPMLSDFERKLQTCAFQQADTLIREYENPPELNEVSFEDSLITKCKMDNAIFQAASVEDLNLAGALITNSLEIYYNSRYYSLGPRR